MRISDWSSDVCSSDLRGVTYSDTLPEGSALVEGEWWPKSYEGPPLISLDREAAKVMNVGIGDTLVVSVLGREIEARIASLRQVHWETKGFNYLIIFSPNTRRAAPPSLAVTERKHVASGKSVDDGEYHGG